MINIRIEKAATEYANRHFLEDVDSLMNKPWPEAREIYERVFKSGANFALSHQWESPSKKTMPEYTFALVLALGKDGLNPCVAIWDGKEWTTIDNRRVEPYLWMPIPIPPLNPETNKDENKM